MPGNTNQLRLVVAPASDHAEGIDLIGLIEYIEDRSGISIDIKLCSSYKEAIDKLSGGAAELGWLGPYAYMDAVREGAPIEAFAVGVPLGQNSPTYHSVFIASANGPIQTLDDAKGCRIAVSDPHSTSGYLVPRSILYSYGINLDNNDGLGTLVNAHDHDAAIRCVIEGKADLAAVSSINLNENIARELIRPNDIRIIHRSHEIPAAPLVYSRNLSNQLKEEIKTLVLEAHKHIRVGGYGGLLEKYIDPLEGRDLYLTPHLRPQWSWKVILGVSIFIALSVLTVVDLEINFAELWHDSFAYFSDIIGRMLPPDFSQFGKLMRSLLETIEIAFLGTLLAILLSIPIGIFSARNIAPNYLIYFVARTVTIFFRAIPEFIMAMILVIAIGFGAMPGVIALGLHTMGFLAKFYAESIEHVDTGPIDALEATGASRYQVVMFSIIPQFIPSFLAYNLYIFDRNIRMATMLGIVGAGGIGYELQSSFRMFEYQRVSAIILVIFAAIFVIDLASSQIRQRVQ